MGYLFATFFFVDNGLELKVYLNEELIKEKVSSKATVSGSVKPKAAPSPAVPVKPLSPEELKKMLAKSKESEDDDCLMCGS